MAISENILEGLKGWGKHPVFIELTPRQPPVYTSAEQFKVRIEETACLLQKFGVQKKYLVPLFLENSIDFARIFLALIHIGAVPVALKLDYRKIELDEIFDNARPQAVITENYHLNILQNYVEDLIVIDRLNGKLNLHQSPAQKPKPADIPDEIASINFTYRGYGYPIGAMVPHTQYIKGAQVLQDGLNGCAGENMLVILPMPHIFTLIGCLLVPLLFSMTSIIARTVHPRLIFEYIRTYHIDYITSVPEIFELFWKFRDMAPHRSSLKAFVSGGSLLSEDSYNKIKQAFGIDLLHGYGLTEFTPASRNIRGRARPGTIGPVCSGINCNISYPDTDGAGEILISTPHMARAYYRRPRETADAFEGGWFKTGDIGRMHEDHLVFLKEKKKTRKVNGNIVDLEEVKKAVLLYDNVTDAKISYSNNALISKVMVDSGADFKKEVMRLKNFLKGIISVYKIPKFITQA